MPISAKERTKPYSDYMKSLGAFVINIPGNAYLAGIPDLIACYQGRFIAVEVKRASGGKVSRIQRATLSAIKKAGGATIIASSMDEFRSEFSALNQ